MKLLIVESPSKIKTITRFLGSEYKVLASFGHILDLQTRGAGGFGIDLNSFEGQYKIDKGKEKVVEELKKAQKESSEIYLATDPDREGEAIAFHLAQVLDLNIKTAKRLEFNEITKDAVLRGLENTRILNENLYNSQETRRMLDRIVGFSLSKLLQKKQKLQSAGRVQSAVLKLIVDKENERRKFVPEEYWNIKAVLNYENEKINVDLFENYDGTNKVSNETAKNDVVSKFGVYALVKEVKERVVVRQAPLPFKTSSLQQEVFSKFGYTTNRTSFIVQKLYEGVEIAGEQTGLITYIRTDSTRLSPTFLAHASSYITKKYGVTYLGGTRVQKGRGNIQDAHEAIRPTDLFNTPEKVEPYLTKEQFNVYRLIYARTVASLMPAGKDEVTDYIFTSNGNLLKATSTTEVFAGFRKAYSEFDQRTLTVLPKMYVGDELKIIDITEEQKFTEPPSRFTEGRLVNTMEKLGIGRPSTYASTINVLRTRGYIKTEKRTLVPTADGELVVELLSEHFSDLLSSDYTANMELDLDKIASGDLTKHEFLSSFYEEFKDLVVAADAEMPKKEVVLEKVGRKCPKCGSDLIYREGRYGRFIGCSSFATTKCNYSETITEYVNEQCPKCGSPLVYRYNQRRVKYIRCSNYQHCSYYRSIKKNK